MPVFERYFLGGGETLRGFAYRSVGPTVNRRNVGGQTMLLVTSEISHPIWGPIRGAVFADIGNAWADAYEMDFSDINIGAGYGLRIKIPQLNVPIKLDLAYPVLNNLPSKIMPFSTVPMRNLTPWNMPLKETVFRIVLLAAQDSLNGQRSKICSRICV